MKITLVRNELDVEGCDLARICNIMLSKIASQKGQHYAMLPGPSLLRWLKARQKDMPIVRIHADENQCAHLMWDFSCLVLYRQLTLHMCIMNFYQPFPGEFFSPL